MIPTRYAVALVSLVFVIGLAELCAPVRAQDPTTQPLVGPSSLTYEGAFCLPQTSSSGIGNPNSFHDGAEGMGFDPYTNTLVVQGNYRYGNAARVTVPTPVIGGCPRAALAGVWIDTLWRFPNRNPAAQDVRLESFLPLANGDLIASFHHYYDANNSQVLTHARMFANGTVSAKVTVGTVGRAGFISGWMTPIPAEWQGLFGGAALTGNGSRSIISTMSLGPAAWVFNPADVPARNPAPATEVLGYPIAHPTLGTCETGTIFNCAASNHRAGLVWVQGTRALLYAHSVCPQPPTYSGGWSCAVGRVTRWLAYDANDLLAVKNGQAQPWDLLPVVWDAGPEIRSKPMAGGIAHDPLTGRVFVAERWGDGPQPKIHVYRVSGSGGTTPPPSPPPPPAPTDTTPPVVSIVQPSGASVSGPMEIVAAASDNVGVVGVRIEVDGVLLEDDRSGPTFDAFWPNPTGTHTIRAVARDAAGNTVTVSRVVTLAGTTPPPPPVDPCVEAPVRLSVGAWPVHVSGRQTQMRYTVTTPAVSWRLTDVRPDRIEVTDSRGCTAQVTR